MIKDELQMATDWPLPTTVTGSQKTALESSRRGRQRKEFGSTARHERGGRGRGRKRGRGRRQGKDRGRGEATKVTTAAAGYRKQSTESDSMKPEMKPIDSGETNGQKVNWCLHG